MPVQYIRTAAVVLRNGKVLVAGLGAVEVYDPSTGEWSTGSAPPDQDTQGGIPTTLLPDGNVLAMFSYLPQLYDPSTNAWSIGSAIPGVQYFYRTISFQPHEFEGRYDPDRRWSD